MSGKRTSPIVPLPVVAPMVSIIELQAKSRHQHLASLGVYVHLGAETAARVTADHDPATRRRHNW